MSLFSDKEKQITEMNRLYSFQRDLYDMSRKYYLQGRDTLLKKIEIQSGDRVCEVGTGTARNLIFLANLHSNARYYGIDISTEMLKTAKKQITRRGLTEAVHISHGLAETLDYRTDFGLNEPFDAIFFSFSLSIMPKTSVQPALQAAWDNLRPGGTCYLVDFGDLSGWPRWIRSSFRKWLSLFHVEYREEIYKFLKTLSVETYRQEEVLGRYTIIAAATKPM